MLGISELVINYWYLWLAASIGSVLGAIYFYRTNLGRRTIDWVKLNAPICRLLFTKLYLTRATRTMGTMINAGVSILDMIAIVKPVTNNVYYEDLWSGVEERLKEGAQLSQPLFESKLIPRSTAQMIFSGEKAGRLGQVMEHVAEFTEAEFDLAVKTTTQFIEPLMIAVMGGIIGFVAISLLLPIFSVGKVVAGR